MWLACQFWLGLFFDLGGRGHVVGGIPASVRHVIDDVRGAVGPQRQALAPAGQHAQVVVVGVVLHHQHDDVLDLRQQVGALGQVRPRPAAGVGPGDPAPPDRAALQPLPHPATSSEAARRAARRSPVPPSFPPHAPPTVPARPSRPGTLTQARRSSGACSLRTRLGSAWRRASRQAFATPSALLSSSRHRPFRRSGAEPRPHWLPVTPRAGSPGMPATPVRRTQRELTAAPSGSSRAGSSGRASPWWPRRFPGSLVAPGTGQARSLAEIRVVHCTAPHVARRSPG